MIQKSQKERKFWAQFDALEMGTGWDDIDITKPQIMVESIYGDSHPGSFHLNQMVEQDRLVSNTTSHQLQSTFQLT